MSTGEVLIKDFSVGPKPSGETLSLRDETRPEIRLELAWTFPMRFADVVVGNGEKVERERIDLADTTSFGNRAVTVRLELKGKKWLRVEAWDIAGNGAFSQPVWIEP